MKRGWKHAALEAFLEDETDMLAISANDPFYTGACEHCQGRLSQVIEGINTRDIACAEGKLTALSWALRGSRGRPSMVCRYAYGCTMCGWVDE